MLSDNLFTGKIRIKLLTKLFLNPASKVYLRGLEKDLGVSSNTVRLELNKLSQMQLIEVQSDEIISKQKKYSVNKNHPLFASLRSIILKYVGLDQILEEVIKKLGKLEYVFLTGELAKGNNSTYVDLVIVGDIDKNYLYQLIDKVEPIVGKKIRVGIFNSLEFTDQNLKDLGITISLLDK